MGHNSNTFGKDQKKARSLKQGKTPKVGALPVQKSAAHETRFNIQSSINHLMERNTTLFGPAGRNFYNPMAKKKLGGDSGAPHNGQPTAAQFFNFGPVPQGPVGFYMHGGINLPEAFPQQPTPGVFFSGAPWQYAQGGQPCYECGGAHMEMGGTNQYGGVNDGSMDVFAKGGNWIQKATADIKKRGTEGKCSGSKFGGPGCPPGSKQYNLAKTFRSMAKKAYGGTADGEDQDDYTGNRAKQFSNVLRMNYGMAEADNQAMRLQDELDNMIVPMGLNGINMDPNMINQNNMNNYMMAQGMLNNMDDKQAYNQYQMLGAAGSWAGDMSNPNNSYVKWKFKPSMDEGGDWAAAIAERDRLTAEEDQKYAQDKFYADQARKQSMYGQRNAYYANDPRDYWNSNNGQTNYDYGTPQGYNNIRQIGNRASWNTPGWGGPNPFFNQMYGNPGLTTVLSDYKQKNRMFGSGPKKIKMHFDTYKNQNFIPNQQPGAGDPRYNQTANPQTSNTSSTGSNSKSPYQQNTQMSPYEVFMSGQGSMPTNAYPMAGANGGKYMGPDMNEPDTDLPQMNIHRKSPFGAGFPAMYGPVPNAFFGRPTPMMPQTGPMQADGSYRSGGMFNYGGFFREGGFDRGAMRGDMAMINAPAAVQADGAEDVGGYDLTGKLKHNLSGQTKYGLGMGTLALTENLFNAPQRNAMEADMMFRTRADQVYNPNEVAYRGNTTQTGAGYGDQFGGIRQSKNGGMIYANGGAYETGVPLDLTDEEVEAIMAAGGTVRYI